MDTIGLNRTEIEALRRDAALGTQLARIATLPDWTPTQRITAQILIINGRECPEYGHRVIEGKSAEDIADWVGASPRTVREAIVALEGAGVVQRDINRFPVNKFGAEIPRAKMDVRRGDRFQTETTIALPLELPELPQALSESKNVKRSRVLNLKRTAEFRELKEKLQKLLDDAPCPNCGTVGHLHVHIGATCTSCGSVLDEGEVEALAGTEIISTPECPPNFEPEAPVNALQALRELKGKATPLPPGIDYKNYDDGGLVIEMPTTGMEIISTPSQPSESEKFSPQSVRLEFFPLAHETRGGGDRVGVTTTTLTGAAILEYLNDQGAQFCLVEGKNGRRPCDDFGDPMPGNYLDMPQSLPVAAAELKRGGTVGLLPEHSKTPAAHLTLLDIDYGLGSLLKMWPGLASAPKVFREDAPDRAKLLVLVSDFGPKTQRQDAKEPTRKAELLGRGHGNIAGRHPSGAEYKLTPGTLMVFKTSEIENMLAQWIPNPYTAEGGADLRQQPPLSVSSLNPAQNVQVSGDMVRPAIQWWNADKANQQEVDRLLSGCTKAGKFVSIRVDDSTPSTTRTDLKDDFYKRTWRDYGTQQTFDDYELYCLLNGFDKSHHKWLVVNEWRVSQGKRPLQLK